MSDTVQAPATIRRTYLALAGLYTLSASLIWGVNTLFLLDAGLRLDEVFLANAFFTGGMVLFEIPTGVVADTVGRRASFLLSVAVLAGTTLGYVGLAQVGATLPAYAVVSALMGLGFTFYSGATEAWLVDALAAAEFDGRLDGVFAQGQMVSGAAMLVGTVGGGALGQVDLALPFVVRAGLLVALFGVALALMHDQGFQRRGVGLRAIPAEMRAITVASVRFGWSQPSLRLLMLSAALQTGFLTWGWYAWQPYFLDLLGSDAVWVAGVVAALVSLTMIAGNALVAVVRRRARRRTTVLLGAASLASVGALVVGLATSFWVAVPGFLLVALAFGLSSPVRQAYFHEMVPSQQRATVLSFDSMIANVGGTGGQVGLGRYSERAGIGPGYVVGAVGLALVVPLVAGVRRRGEDADALGGPGIPRQVRAGRLRRRPRSVP